MSLAHPARRWQWEEGVGWRKVEREYPQPPYVVSEGGLHGSEGMWHPPRQKSGDVRPGFSLSRVIEVGRGKN